MAIQIKMLDASRVDVIMLTFFFYSILSIVLRLLNPLTVAALKGIFQLFFPFFFLRLLHYAADTNVNLANMKFANCATLETGRFSA